MGLVMFVLSLVFMKGGILPDSVYTDAFLTCRHSQMTFRNVKQLLCYFAVHLYHSLKLLGVDIE